MFRELGDAGAESRSEARATPTRSSSSRGAGARTDGERQPEPRASAERRVGFDLGRELGNDRQSEEEEVFFILRKRLLGNWERLTYKKTFSVLKYELRKLD
jgi:hypothetical protein